MQFTNKTEEIFEPLHLSRDEKKRIRDHADYYRKNREHLLAKVYEKAISFNRYDVVPIKEYYDFEYKKSHSEMANIFVDRNNFLERMAETLYMYGGLSTYGKLSKETGRSVIIPYSDALFYRFFMLKLITLPCYQIPLLLDYHYPKYSTVEVTTVKRNKFNFLLFIEFTVVDLLERFSPFNYELQGIEVVKWLKERKRKYGNLSTEEILANIKAAKSESETKISVELASLLKSRAQDHFRGLENRFKKARYIEEDNLGKLTWTKSKDDMMALILIMNKHNYFGINFLEPANKLAKANLKLAFERRFNVGLKQYFEPARIKLIDIKKYEKINPFSTIAPPIPYGQI